MDDPKPAAAKTPMEEVPWEDPALLGESIDFVAILAALLKRWPFLLAAGAFGFLLAAGYAFIKAPVFTSKAVFLPPPAQVPTLDNTLAMFWKPQSTAIYPGLLASTSVADDVIAHGDLIRRFRARDLEGARTSLRQATSISTDTAGFVTLAVTDKSPESARDIANDYLAALSRVNDRLAIDSASQHRRIFQVELQKEENELESAETDLKKAQEASGVVSAQAQTETGLRSIDTIQAEIRQQQVVLAALLQGQTEESPEVVKARSQLRALEGQLQRMQSGSGGAAGSGLSAAHAPEVNLEFVRLERRLKYHQVLLEAMMRQFETAKQEETTAANGVQIVDYPQIPLRKSAPRRTVIAIVGAVLGFLGGLAWVAVKNRWEFLHANAERARSMAVLRDAVRHATVRP